MNPKQAGNVILRCATIVGVAGAPRMRISIARCTDIAGVEEPGTDFIFVRSIRSAAPT